MENLIQNKIDNFIEKSRAAGYNVTFQRIEIFKVVLEHGAHPSAEEVFTTIKQKYPSISLATVYKTLDTLVDLGLIYRVNPLYDSARFETRLVQHHHLVCTQCKKIVDIPAEELPHIPHMTSLKGFEIKNLHIQMSGICPGCREKMQLTSNS